MHCHLHRHQSPPPKSPPLSIPEPISETPSPEPATLKTYPFSQADLLTIPTRHLLHNDSFEEIAQVLQYTQQIQWVDENAVGFFPRRERPIRTVSAEDVEEEFRKMERGEHTLSYNAWWQTLQQRQMGKAEEQVESAENFQDREMMVRRCELWYELGRKRKEKGGAVELGLERVDVPFMPFQGI
ncbi:MAG: hypothetical protein Q9202_005407 [Teloschistes flavicans]